MGPSVKSRVTRLASAVLAGLGPMVLLPTPGHVAAATSTVPAGGRLVSQFPISANAYVQYITAAPDGVWFSETSANTIGHLTYKGVLTEFTDDGALGAANVLPPSEGINTGSAPEGITVGSDGNVWFLEGGSPASLGRLTPQGVFTDFVLAGYVGRVIPTAPQSIVSGPDGNLWFTDPGAGAIARFTVASAPSGSGQQTGSVTEFPVPGALADNGAQADLLWNSYAQFFWLLNGIVVGPDGALWFPAGTATIGRISMSGTVSEYTLPSRSTVIDITPGRDHALWFTEGYQTVVEQTPSNGRQFSRLGIGRIAVDGTITEYVASDVPSWFLSSGPEGALWFTSAGDATTAVGRMTLCGDETTYVLPSALAGIAPYRIVLGADGNVWFTERYGNAIARIDFDYVAPMHPCPSAVGGGSHGARAATRSAAALATALRPGRPW